MALPACNRVSGRGHRLGTVGDGTYVCLSVLTSALPCPAGSNLSPKGTVERWMAQIAQIEALSPDVSPRVPGATGAADADPRASAKLTSDVFTAHGLDIVAEPVGGCRAVGLVLGCYGQLAVGRWLSGRLLGAPANRMLTRSTTSSNSCPSPSV